MAHDVIQKDADQVARIRATMERMIGEERMNLWFTEEVQWNLHNDGLIISAPNEFALRGLQRRFDADLQQALICSTGRSGTIEYRVCEPAIRPEVAEHTHAGGAGLAEPVRLAGSGIGGSRIAHENRRPAAIPSGKLDGSHLTESQQGVPLVSLPSRNTPEERKPTPSDLAAVRVNTNGWEQFIVGSCNKLAHTAASMTCSQPGSVSPLLLHGPTGCGKSHLAQAIAQRLRQSQGLRRVIHLSSEQFTNDFTEAIRGKGLPSFRKKYRDIDAIVLDDIQFFLGKKATLQELKHTLDTLLRQNKQIVLVADRSLNDLAGLGQEIHTRLAGGMVCPMESIDAETRFQLLLKITKQYGVSISEALAKEFAEHSIGDARLLYGIVHRLRALGVMKQGAFDDREARDATHDLVRTNQQSVRLSDIERAVCEVFGLDPKSLQTKCKGKSLSQPRMLAMFLARKYTKAAYTEIGEYFGHRRHSTVISAEKKVGEWLKGETRLSAARGSVALRDALRNVEATLQIG